MDIEATRRLRARLRTPEAQARPAAPPLLACRCCACAHADGTPLLLPPAAVAAAAGWHSRRPGRPRSPLCLQGKAERLMDIVSTISHGRGATLGARQLWARMSGTMRRLRRSLHSLLQQVRGGPPRCQAA